MRTEQTSLTTRIFGPARSELIRIRGTAKVTGLVMVAITALVTSFTFLKDNGEDSGGGRGPLSGTVTDLASADGALGGLTASLTILGIATLALFAISVARDHETGMIRNLLVGEPNRFRLLAGKIGALSALTAISVMAAAIVSFSTALIYAPMADIDTVNWTTGSGLVTSLSTLFNVIVVLLVWGLIGAALAMVTRSAAAAITAGIGYLVVGENLIGLMWDTGSNWLPSGTLETIATGGSAEVSYLQAALLGLAYAGAAGIATFATFIRRDVTD